MDLLSTKGNIGIIALESCKDIGQSIDKALQEKRDENSFVIDIDEIRFSNGEGKVKLRETVRGKDIYILCDVGNYSCSYQMYGITNYKGPDEHFQDIKRAVSAIGGKAKRVIVIMPLMYESRQHRRRGRESLDCAIALQELERLGVEQILTFDVHDPNVQNAIPLISFESLYPTYDIVKTFIKEEEGLNIDKSNMIVISPDTGAMDRAIYYSSVLGLDVGLFYKRRDHTRVVEGCNPIIQHEYLGRDLENKDVLIVDDMICSGQSVIDIVNELKERKANRVYIATTFALFTKGIEEFDKMYEEGLIEKVYSTNLTYVPPKLKSAKWYKEVNMAEFIANVIDNINQDQSISPILDATESIKKLLNS